MKISRRKLLIGGALAGLGGYSVARGLRYPTLSWSPTPLAQARSFKDCDLTLAKSIFSSYRFLDQPVENTADQEQVDLEKRIYIRAFDTEPKIELSAHSSDAQNLLVVNNVSPLAQLKLHTDNPKEVTVEEEIQGITRHLTITAKQGETVHLKWQLPKDKQQYKVACIGDSGGGEELAWCLKRAEQLEADFFVHLGDFVYNPGEYDLAIEKFYNSSIPCYISIGNHDFHDNGLIYPQFREQLSPLNHTINILGTQLINLDTAADFFPVDGGLRGRFVETLLADQNQYNDRLILTHRPIKDPRQGEDHNVGSVGEVDWLKQLCQELKVSTYVNGHVHNTADNDLQGLRQITVGEGLGFNDILLKKQFCRLLMLDIRQGEKPELSLQPLNMQDQYRCSSYLVRTMLGRDHHRQDITDLQKQQMDLCKVDI